MSKKFFLPTNPTVKLKLTFKSNSQKTLRKWRTNIIGHNAVPDWSEDVFEVAK